MMLLFQATSVLKTLQFGNFTHTQNAPVGHEEDTKHISSGSTNCNIVWRLLHHCIKT